MEADPVEPAKPLAESSPSRLKRAAEGGETDAPCASKRFKSSDDDPVEADNTPQDGAEEKVATDVGFGAETGAQEVEPAAAEAGDAKMAGQAKMAGTG